MRVRSTRVDTDVSSVSPSSERTGGLWGISVEIAWN